MKNIRPFENEDRLSKHVRCWINNTRKDGGYGDVDAVINDLIHGGCQSGMVGHLINYTDTVSFYKRYQAEIDDRLKEMLAETGLSINELFGDKWDLEDPLARDYLNKNLLAWFGFEESARAISERIGMSS